MAETVFAQPLACGSRCGQGRIHRQERLCLRATFFAALPAESSRNARRRISGLSLIAGRGKPGKRSCAFATSKDVDAAAPAEAEQTVGPSALPGQTRAKSGAKLHDFCLGIPYGGALVAVSIAGLGTSASRFSLGSALLAGVLILILSSQSLKVWKRGESSLLHIGNQAIVAITVLGWEVYLFCKTKALAIFPAAIVSVLSAAMFLFYAYVYLAGGNPVKKAKLT